ncbi:hypothetical protein Pelo_4025 [Pelomyxa schiedti]|nr:hypothetical protein Pelo_4025 [Pelomyxa schiedti]
MASDGNNLDGASLDFDMSVLDSLTTFNFGEELEEEAKKLEPTVKKQSGPVYDERGFRLPTPGLEAFPVKVQTLDGQAQDVTVTHDWVIRDIRKIIADRLGLDETMFFMQEMPPSNLSTCSVTVSLSWARWLQLDSTMTDLGITSGSRMLLRMRWILVPRMLHTNKPLLTQFFHHLRHFFVVESAPVEKRVAIRLAGIHFQFTQGNYDSTRHLTGFVSKNIRDYLSELVIGAKALDVLEGAVVSSWAHNKGMTAEQAMMEYIKTALREAVCFGAQMYDVKGAGHSSRRLAIMEDGLAFYFGRVDDFTFLTYKEIRGIGLSQDDDGSAYLSINHTGPDPRVLENIKVYTAHPDILLIAVCGYCHLLSDLVPVPSSIPPINDLPNKAMFLHRNRPDISRYRTRLELIKRNLKKQFKATQRAVPTKIVSQMNAALEENKPWEALELANCDLDEKSMQLIATAFDTAFKFKSKIPLVENVCIQSIDLSGNPLRDGIPTYGALKTILACPIQTKTIVLRRIDISQGGGALSDALKAARNLESIDVSYNPAMAGTKGLSELIRGLRTAKALHTMLFANTGIAEMNANDLYELIHRHMESLVTLDLQLANFIGDASMTALCPALKLCTKLESLNLGKCQIDVRSAMNLLEAISDLPALKHLFLGDNRVGPKFCETLAKHYLSGKCPSLLFLDVSLNELQSDSLEVLLKALPKGIPLQELLIGGNILSSSGIESCIHNMVIPTRKLSVLGVRSSDLTKGSILAVCEAIKQGIMTRVDLAFNEFNDKCTNKLVEAVTVSRLETLNLAGCGFTNKEAIKLFDALANLRTLKSIRLDVSKISGPGLMKLAATLRVNQSINTIGMCEIEATTKEIQDFLAAIPETTSLTSLDLRNNKLMPVHIKEHTTHLSKVDVLI